MKIDLTKICEGVDGLIISLCQVKLILVSGLLVLDGNFY